MTGSEKRATLDFGDLEISPTPPVDPRAVQEATRAAGFRETPKATEQGSLAQVRPARRVRRKTGRTEQFATRLRGETISAIHAYADQHEITLAETIERAMDSLQKVERLS